MRFLDILRKLASEQPKDLLLQVGGMWQAVLLSKDGATKNTAHGGGVVPLAQLEAVHRSRPNISILHPRTKLCMSVLHHIAKPQTLHPTPYTIYPLNLDLPNP